MEHKNKEGKEKRCLYQQLYANKLVNRVNP